MNIKNPLKNERGVALLMAIATVTLISYIAVEMSYDSISEYLIASQEINRMKAHYAAKAGVDLSLLRINIYEKVYSQFGKQMGSQSQVLDQIWQAPFFWPPVLPTEASRVDKEQLKSIVKNSLMEATYSSTITSEGSKIDLNDLISPSKSIAEHTKETLIRLLETRLERDDPWAMENRGKIKPIEIVNNIIDWIDADTLSLNGGDESALYQNLNLKDQKLPPNQAFKTISELHMVAGVTDEIYNFLLPSVTVYGLKGVQVNYAPKDLLMGIGPGFTAELADAIIERRTSKDGPFKDEQDFDTFVSSRSGLDPKTLKDKELPLLFDAEHSFRIISTGSAGQASSEIVAIVYDFDKVKERLVDALSKDKQQAGTPGGTQDQTQKPPPAGTAPTPLAKIKKI